jgi:hypothetical protein
MAKDDFLNELNTWIGTAFGLDGHTKGVTTNCSRFVLDAARSSTSDTQALNIFSQLLQIRYSEVNSDTIENIFSQLRTISKTVSIDELRAGDIVLIVVSSRLRSMLAIAVAINPREVIYCNTSQGVMIGQLTKVMLKNVRECLRLLIWGEGI